MFLIFTPNACAGSAFLSMRMQDHPSRDKCLNTVVITAVMRRQVGGNARLASPRRRQRVCGRGGNNAPC